MSSESAKAYIEDRSVPEPNTGCWLWERCVDKHGYGRVGVGSKGQLGSPLAHRFSFAAFHSDPEDRLVCHSCDNPTCVNPGHLFLGTPADNAQDRDRKGRRLIKLTLNDAVAIRARLAAGETGASLAREFGVSYSQITHIRNGSQWRNV